MTGDSSDEKQKTHLGKDAGASLPAGRPGMESDMAAAVLYLASRGGNFVTGGCSLSIFPLRRLRLKQGKSCTVGYIYLI